MPHKTFRFRSLISFFTFVPSSVFHLRSFFTSSPFVWPFRTVFILFTSLFLYRSFHRSFFAIRFSRELVEAFVAHFSSSSRTVHFLISQLRIVLSLLYVLPLFYLFFYLTPQFFCSVLFYSWTIIWCCYCKCNEEK